MIMLSEMIVFELTVIVSPHIGSYRVSMNTNLHASCGLFGWLVADGWCWFVLREEYCWLVAGG
jgi:hypothetical protein